MKTEDQILDRITVRPDVFGGKPIIRDMRIAVDQCVISCLNETVDSDDSCTPRL